MKTGSADLRTPEPVKVGGADLRTPEPVKVGGADLRTPEPMKVGGDDLRTPEPVKTNNDDLRTPEPVKAGSDALRTPEPVQAGGDARVNADSAGLCIPAPVTTGIPQRAMRCSLCGSVCQRKQGARSAFTFLPRSNKTVAELLGDIGHPVPYGAHLCLSCLGLARELESFIRRTALVREKIDKRALLKAKNTAIPDEGEATTREKVTPATHSEPTEEEEAKEEAEATKKPEAEARNVEPAESLLSEKGLTGSEAADTGATPTPCTRRSSRRLAQAPPAQSEDATYPAGDGDEGGVSSLVSGGDGGGAGDGVSRANPSAVKDEPMETGDPMDEGGDDGGDSIATDFSAEWHDSEQGHEAADSSREWTEGEEDRRRLHRPRRAESLEPGSKRPAAVDWNARWRSKTMKNTSWRDRLVDDWSSVYKTGTGELRSDPDAEEQTASLPVGPAARVKVEPGTETDGGGACTSGAGGAAPNLDDKIFRVGRKVVTRQSDGSAVPAVKVLRQNRRGHPKVAFLDHKTALREAARLDRVREVLDAASQALPPQAAKSQRPPRRRPPRVMTKPPAEEAPLLPSDVGWMAAGAADGQPWLAAEGAVHAVLDVQPGEAWVDAIARSEAAAASPKDWADGAAQLPVPLAHIKTERPE